MTPPPLADAILRILLPRGFRGDAIRGDLFEEYLARLDQGQRKAAAWYWMEAMRIGLRYSWVRLVGLVRGRGWLQRGNNERGNNERGNNERGNNKRGSEEGVPSDSLPAGVREGRGGGGGPEGGPLPSGPLPGGPLPSGPVPGGPVPSHPRPSSPRTRSLLGGIVRDLSHDLRFGFRGLIREPAWTLSTLGTLGLAIGATSAIFAVVYGVLIRPLPYPDSDRLVILEFTPSNEAMREAAASWDEYIRDHFRHSISFPGYESLRRSLLESNPELGDSVRRMGSPAPETAAATQETAAATQETGTPIQETATAIQETATAIQEPATAIQEPATAIPETAAAIQEAGTAVQEPGNPRPRSEDPVLELGAFDDDWSYNISFGPDAGTERLSGTLASASLFRVLGVPPLVGRWPSDDEDLPDARGAVLLSYEIWQKRFGGRRDVAGLTVTLDGFPYTVAGVMPPGFDFPSETTEIWISLAQATRDQGSSNYEIVGRLPQHVSPDQADRRLASQRVAVPRNEAPDWEVRLGAASLHGYLVGDIRPALLLLFGAVGTLLLIACVNVVNLMLTRATKKEQEHTVRAALGASPGRLARLFLTESVLVSLLGALLGLGMAWAIVKVLPGLVPSAIPRQASIRMDSLVLAFTLGSALIVGLAVGLVPALHAARLRFVTRLMSGVRWASRGSREGLFRDALVVVQLGLALVLLVSGALLVRSFAAILGEETGFDPRSVLAFETSLPRTEYSDVNERRQFYEELNERLRVLPGVRNVGLAIYLPAGGQFHWGDVEIEGHISDPGQEMLVEQKEVSPGYFGTLGMRLLEGRTFQGDRVWSEAREVVVTEKFARRYLPGESPVGRRVNTGGDSPEEEEWWTIVGVVADVRFRGSQRDVPTMYFPYHSFRGGMDAVLKVEGYPESLGVAVRRAVADMDSDVTVFNLMPLEARLSRAVAGPRFQALLVGSFGLLSLLLSVVGIYGVMAYAVARRTREMGIRRALGAESGRLVGRVAVQGLRLTILGIALGMLVILPLTGLLESYLYQLEPHDPATLVLATGILALASMAACLVPALRAARVDPLLALRVE